MRYPFKIPVWVEQFLYDYQRLEDVPVSLFEAINERLDRVISPEPLVTVLIAAWNEEINLLRSINSLSQNKSPYPFEIIVVNNNSTDDTQKVLDKLHVQSLFEAKQGCGPARQLGQEHAKGRYILLADADCIYPVEWIKHMTQKLLKDKVVCIYGRYSFIPDENNGRLQLSFFEKLKDFVAEIRHMKRPYLNAYGISMGYVKKYGLQVGFIDHNTRGDDGRLCFDLMQFGKVKQVKSSKAIVWTFQRTLEKEGSFLNILWNRIYKELSRFSEYFTKKEPHDTKTSKNWRER